MPRSLFPLHQRLPGVFVVHFRRELLVAGEIVAPFAANIAAVAHVISRFAQEEIAADLFPTFADPGIGDDIGEFVWLRADIYSWLFSLPRMYSAIMRTVVSLG